MLPVVTFMIIYAWPKKSLATDTTKTDKIPTDRYFVKSVFFLFLVLINLIFTLLALHLLKNETIMVRRTESSLIHKVNEKAQKEHEDQAYEQDADEESQRSQRAAS